MALAFFPTALSVALRPLFPFQQVQYAQVFLLKPASFCKLFAGLISTIKSATSLISSYLTFALSLPPYPLLHLSFYYKLAGRSGRNCLLFPCIIMPQWVLGHLLLLGNNAADELARRKVLLVPSAILCSLSLLSLVFTHGFPRFPPRNLCSFVTLAVPSLVYTATDTAYC